jgi:fermentation-respiration switch protein FrsA (DUF1100 family)
MIESLVRQFLYHPTRLPIDAPLPGYIEPGASEVFIDLSAGGRVHALHWAADPGRPTILFFHGNAQTVFEWALIREDLAPLDCGLLLVDYPGYGKSDGAPSEAANYDAGHAAMNWLTGPAGVPPERVIVFGKSLGGGITTEIVQGKRVLGVVLESTFTSIPSVMKRLMPMLPAGSLLRSEVYDSVSKVAGLGAPVLVIHGTRDEIIPFEEGEKLFAAAAEPKMFYRVERAGHNDVSLAAGDDYGITLRAWLDEIDQAD